MHNIYSPGVFVRLKLLSVENRKPVVKSQSIILCSCGKQRSYSYTHLQVSSIEIKCQGKHYCHSISMYMKFKQQVNGKTSRFAYEDLEIICQCNGKGKQTRDTLKSELLNCSWSGGPRLTVIPNHPTAGQRRSSTGTSVGYTINGHQKENQNRLRDKETV